MWSIQLHLCDPNSFVLQNLAPVNHADINKLNALEWYSSCIHIPFSPYSSFVFDLNIGTAFPTIFSAKNTFRSLLNWLSLLFINFETYIFERSLNFFRTLIFLPWVEICMHLSRQQLFSELVWRGQNFDLFFLYQLWYSLFNWGKSNKPSSQHDTLS